MKKLTLLLTLLLWCAQAEAASKYLINNGGNWTANTSWSTTDAGALLNVNDTTAPTASDDVFLTANSGQCTISASSVGKSLNCTGYTGTLTHNAFTLMISGSVTLVAGMTYTPHASAVLIIASTSTLTTGGKLMQAVTFSASSATTLGDNLSYTATKTCLLTMSSATLNLNGFTISGNSATNRVLITSSSLGTVRTITNTTGTFANADFRDITFSSAADYSAITGLSGDCGGNTNGTFTTAATQTWDGTTGNWSTSARWTSRVPLPQDDVNVAASSAGTLTADMPRLGKSIDFTGGGALTWSPSNSVTSYGSVTLISAMSVTGGTGTHLFEGRSAFTITSAGKTWTNTVSINSIGGSYSLLDAINTGSANLRLASGNGTFNSNGFNITTNLYSHVAGITSNLSSSTFTLTGTGAIWTGASTLNAGTSTILISDTGASSKTFAGGGLTYNNLSISGGGAGAVIITGANTFNRIYTDGLGTKSITLPGSTTTTILSGEGLGNGTNVITFTASAGSATISKSGGGSVAWDYVSLTNIPAASTGASYYAGSHSTDGGGNTNWLFYDAPMAELNLMDFYSAYKKARME